MSRQLTDVLGLDLRSLAVFRVCLGLLLLVDALDRARNTVAHYTDAGVYPRDLLFDHWQKGYWSLHTLDGGAGLQLALFGLAALVAVQLIVGWRTKVAHVVGWVLLSSVQARNPLVLQGGDDLLRLITFWSMFLPLGATWSLDAKREGDRGEVVVSAASLAFMLQLALMYWATAILKRGPEWLPNGTAVTLALRWETYSTPLADLMLLVPFPALKVLTYGVLVWEYLGPLLIFVPWRQQRIRLFVVVSMLLMHIGFGTTLTLGLFSFTSCAAWLALIPPVFWDRADELRERRWVPGSRVVSAFVAVLLLYVVMWNARTLAFKQVEVVFPRSINPIAYTLRLEQYWTMFAPSPPRYNTWWIIEGHLDDGTVVDLYSMQPFTEERPADISATYPGQRWRKFMFNLPAKRHMQPMAARWFRDRWEAANPDRPAVRHVRLVTMSEFTRVKGHDPAVRKAIALYTVRQDGTLERVVRPDFDVKKIRKR
ncbi:MAG: hypothetical protein ACI8PZ_005075 [Myxococcota bacterium]|jgi:hypothetical protein